MVKHKHKHKLTKEELYHLKLAKKQQQEEQKRQIKRDQLARELKYAEVNKRRLESEWKEMLTKIRLQDLRIELDVLINDVERILDLKDFYISVLLDTLSAAEEQYNCNFMQYVEDVDNILDVYDKRLDDLKENFDTDFTKLKEYWQKECNKLTKTADIEIEEIKVMIFGLEKQRLYIEKVLKADYLSKLNFEKAQYDDDEFIMKNKREENFGKMWSNCKSIVKKFIKSRREVKKEYDKIHVHDVETRNIIAKQTIQLFDLQQNIKNLRLTLQFKKEELDLKMESKRKELKYFTQIYKKLRKKFQVTIDLDNAQLFIVVSESNKILRVLQTKVEKVEIILKRAEITRKFETRIEKILPFPKLYIDENDKDILKKEIKSFHTLPFWMKCGQSKAVTYHLQEEKHTLKQENVILKKHLKKYCSGHSYCGQSRNQTKNS